MKLTLEQAFNLKPGDILLDNGHRNKAGEPRRWKVNGQVKTWVRDKGRIRVPLKHGLRNFDHLTETDFDNGVCVWDLELES